MALLGGGANYFPGGAIVPPRYIVKKGTAMHPQCALVLNYFFTCLTPDDFTRPLSRNAPYLFFTCLTPDDFNRQWGSSAEL